MATRGYPGMAQISAAAPPASGGIGGALPWGAGAGNLFQGMTGDPNTVLANLGPNYANAYNASLAQNQANYNNILAGYEQTAGTQQAAQQGVTGGYNALAGSVQGQLAGSNASNIQGINDAYARQAGAADQNLISSGLGNSTVRSSVQRGIGLDQQKALTGSNNAFAQLQASYASQLGQAGLNYQGQAVRDNTALSQDQLHWMNSVNAGYPDAGMYGQLAQQAGAAIQGNANRDQIDRMAAQTAGLGGQIRQAAVLGGSGGVVPSSGGRLPPSSVNWGAGSTQGPGAQNAPSFFNSGGGFGGTPYGGGGAMQGLSTYGGGASAGGTDWGDMGYDFGAAAGGMFGPTDQADQGDGFYGLTGGYPYSEWDTAANPFGFGGDYTATPAYGADFGSGYGGGASGFDLLGNSGSYDAYDSYDWGW